MAKKQTRDNEYLLGRLEREHPSIEADRKAGKYASDRQALLAAGLIKRRTPVHELKNAWKKATPSERKEFLEWVRTTGTSRKGAASMAVDRYLEPGAKARIQTIMARRKMKMGAVMKEMGFNPLDASLGLALAGRTRLRPDVLMALEAWVKANAHV